MKVRFAVAPVLLCLLSACSLNTHVTSSPPPGKKGVAVRVTFREIPLPEARVDFRRSPGGEDGPPAATGRTDRDGIATFDLPAGRYLLVAQWRADGDYSRPIAAGDRHAYFGGNPVFTDEGAEREIFLGLEEHENSPAVPNEPPGGTGVSGRVVSGGAPAAGAIVFAYPRAEPGFRDPGAAAAAITGPDGSFVLDLPPGNYHLVVRRRAAGGVAGPMRKGDLFGYYPANPVSVHTGAYIRVSIPATVLKLRNAPSYSAQYRSAAVIEGRILGRDGVPREGVFAALYGNPELLNRPSFLSEVTGADGRYRLPVPVPGAYFLGARTGYGGSPAPGDLYGRYEGNPDHSVTVRQGDHLTGIDITVHEVR
jgi:hypothetical protein